MCLSDRFDETDGLSHASHDPTAKPEAHATQARVYLRKSKEERRIATLVDSPYLPEGEALFTIVANGIADA
jgi:hypothetical protein